MPAIILYIVVGRDSPSNSLGGGYASLDAVGQ